MKMAKGHTVSQKDVSLSLRSRGIRACFGLFDAVVGLNENSRPPFQLREVINVGWVEA
jgi:hypothetical protein